MKTLSFLALFLLSTIGFTQPKGKKGGPIRERIRSERVAFITDRLSLSAEEAQRFWPVYNKFTDQLEEVKKQQRENRKTTNDKLAVLSDKEVERLLQEELSAQQQIVDLQRKYQVELAKVIPVKKIAMLYKAEHDFKITLLRKMRESGQKPPPEEEF
jgi:hypothetical protein